jgi:sugar phosphate permease
MQARTVPVSHMPMQRRPFGQNYAFVVAGVVFVALLVSAGLRSAPGVLMIPWQKAFGWDRGTISLAAAIGIFLYGMVGPFAAALMQSLGVRQVLVGALILMAVSTGLSIFVTASWQLIALWGVFSGVASGCVAMVLAATIVNRWFVVRRGLVTGLLSASTATGTLIFLPAFAALAEAHSWKIPVLIIAAGASVVAVLVWLVLPERPGDIGLVAYGARAGDPPGGEIRANPLTSAITALTGSLSKPDYWFLAVPFFICGFTTNGLVGVHLISLCGDHGMLPVRAAGLMAMMGLFDLVGTTASGWLTDRYDPRKLLFAYYALRGLSLIYLPFSDFSIVSLSMFAVFYGLDWIATLPPTLKLANQAFGEKQAPIVFGWLAAGHQLGAASAAFMAGALRTAQGDYLQAFIIAGSTGLLAAVMSLMVGRFGRGPVLAAA